MRTHKTESNVIKVRRLAERRVNALRALDLVQECQVVERGKNPSGVSAVFWNIPTVSELKTVRERLIKEIGNSALQMIPAAKVFIWARDERYRVFTTYCPFTGEVKDAGVPKNLITSILRGNIPDSAVQHFVYAVAVSRE
jgi:hypothetical protein